QPIEAHYAMHVHRVSYIGHGPAAPPAYALSLHDALPIFHTGTRAPAALSWVCLAGARERTSLVRPWKPSPSRARSSSQPCSLMRSEEHTSELQSLAYLVCRLLLEKKRNVDVLACIVAVEL